MLCSVVVPTRGRPRQLERCLLALAEAAYPPDGFEVVVVGDPLPDATLRRLRGRIEVTGLVVEGTNAATARNVGARHARGEILAFTDDDCRPEPAWLTTLTAHVRPGVGVGGHTVNGLADNRWSAASQSIVDLAYAYYNNGGGVGFLTTNNLAVRADDFHDVGGFDERFSTAEDREFCRRWLARGLELCHVPAAVVHHEHDLKLRSFVRQHFDYGRGAFRFHFRSAGGGDGRLRAALGFQAALPRLLGPNGTSRAARLADVTLWQAANGAGFAWEALVGARRR